MLNTTNCAKVETRLKCFILMDNNQKPVIPNKIKLINISTLHLEKMAGVISKNIFLFLLNWLKLGFRLRDADSKSMVLNFWWSHHHYEHYFTLGTTYIFWLGSEWRCIKPSLHLSTNHGVKLHTLALTIFELESQQNSIRAVFKNVALMLFFWLSPILRA